MFSILDLPLLYISLSALTLSIAILKKRTYTILMSIVVLIGAYIGSSSIIFSKLSLIDLSFDISFTIMLSIATIVYLINIITNPTKPIRHTEISLCLLYGLLGLLFVRTGTLINNFLIWELLSIIGAYIVFQEPSVRAKISAYKYIIIHTFGGTLLYIGIIHYNEGGEFNNFYTMLALAGILVNLGLPPLASWIIDGYSSASPFATTFLSVFTTKSALFLLYKLFYGYHALLYIGIIIAIYAIFMSFFTKNIRKILAYALIHQLGILICSLSYINEYTKIGFSMHLNIHLMYEAIFFILVALLAVNNSNNYFINLISKAKQKILYIIIFIAAINAMGLPGAASFISKLYIHHGLHQALSHSTVLNIIFMCILVAGVLNLGMRVPMMILNQQGEKYKISSYFIGILGLIAVVLVFWNLNYYSAFNDHILNIEVVIEDVLYLLGAVFVLYMYFNIRNKRYILDYETSNMTAVSMAIKSFILFIFSYYNSTLHAFYITLNVVFKKARKIYNFSGNITSSLLLLAVCMAFITYVLMMK